MLSARPMSPSRVVHPELGVWLRGSHPTAVWRPYPPSIERWPALDRDCIVRVCIHLWFRNAG
jgi:hypothetical protein